jgi:DNA-binding Xre family transcriptional regulator
MLRRESPGSLFRYTALVLDVLVLHPDDPRMDDSVREFGNRVRSMRERKQWTQEELAEHSGLTSVQISRIERGAREIRLTTLLRLITAFETKPDKLLAGL